MKVALVTALSACAERRAEACRFLQGLSADELEYIADYFGACILEAAAGSDTEQLAEAIAAFERCHHPRQRRGQAVEDHEHKMIVLVEFLCRCGFHHLSPALGASGQAG